MGRRELREHVFKLLFLGEFNSEEEMTEQMQLYFDTLSDLNAMDEAYMQEKYKKVKASLEEIDELINEASSGWKTKRMGRVELTLMRLAVYEMKYDEDVPVKVAINEAVELCKLFGGEDSSSFLNGILGKIAKRKS